MNARVTKGVPKSISVTKKLDGTQLVHLLSEHVHCILDGALLLRTQREHANLPATVCTQDLVHARRTFIIPQLHERPTLGDE